MFTSQERQEILYGITMERNSALKTLTMIAGQVLTVLRTGTAPGGLTSVVLHT